jgi:RNA polymerase sigma factor (sigma-70 family)
VLSAEEAYARATADLELLEQVVKHVRPRLYAQALSRLKSRADAEILVQDVCSSAWEQDFVTQCAGEWPRMVAYLTRAMKNHLANRYRGRDRERQGFGRFWALVQIGPKSSRSADEDTFAHEIDEITDRALEELPLVIREAFNFVCRDGLKFEEAAKLLQPKSSRTIRDYVSTAKRHVQKALTAAGYGPCAEKREVAL